jgi:hypothetical protein
VCFVFFLGVALLSTVVLATVKSPPALGIAGEAAHKPVFTWQVLRIHVRRRRVLQLSIVERGYPVPSLLAWDFLSLTTAIACGRDWDITAPTQARVAQALTLVVSAWQKISADLLTAPTIGIVCLTAALRGGLFPTEARYAWAHHLARWTRTGVANH